MRKILEATISMKALATYIIAGIGLVFTFSIAYANIVNAGSMNTSKLDSHIIFATKKLKEHDKKINIMEVAFTRGLARLNAQNEMIIKTLEEEKKFQYHKRRYKK